MGMISVLKKKSGIGLAGPEPAARKQQSFRFAASELSKQRSGGKQRSEHCWKFFCLDMPSTTMDNLILMVTKLSRSEQHLRDRCMRS